MDAVVPAQTTEISVTGSGRGLVGVARAKAKPPLYQPGKRTLTRAFKMERTTGFEPHLGQKSGFVRLVRPLRPDRIPVYRRTPATKQPLTQAQ